MIEHENGCVPKLTLCTVEYFNYSPFFLIPINLYLKAPTLANSLPLSDKIIFILLFS
jgi:hypothetical protein